MIAAAATRPLSRTCDLADFPGCLTVAGWQQALADLSWARWQQEQHIRSREQSLCLNFTEIPFLAPGPEAIYRYRGDAEDGIARAVPAVWALCVLEHIDAPVRFLLRAAKILRPGGLLFLTFACWDSEGPDCAEGHADRMRIYDVHTVLKLVGEARRAGFQTFGGVDWGYHGHTLGDHSLASLVLTRRGGPAGRAREAPHAYP